MYPISDTLKQLFLNGNKKCCKLTLNNATTEDCVITEADILSDSLTVDRYCSSGNKIEVGSAIAAELTLTLLNNNDKFNHITFEGSEVSLEIGIDGVEDSYIPCGKFTIDEPPRSSLHIKLRALDFMMLFDKKVDANDVQEIDTVENLLVKCCEICNVEIWDENALKNLPNIDQTVKVPTTADITYRQIVQWIAQLTGTCAFMDWEGKLRLSWFKDSGVVLDPTNRYIGGTLDENNITIKGVCIKTQNTVVTTEDSVNPVVIESNQLLYSDDKTYLETIANNIATGIGALTYRPFQCNTIPMPFLYPLDIVGYEGAAEGDFSTVITNHNFGLNKASALSAVGETATQSGYSSVKGLTKAEIDSAIREAMNGIDAKAEHIHIMYSAYEKGLDASGKASMSDKPDATTEYLGTCADNNATAPDTPSSYKWVKIRGADGIDGKDGQDGKDGKDGKGISEVINYYLTTNKADGVTRDDFGGNTEIVTPDKDKPYLWNYEEIRYTSGNPTYTAPCIIGNFAENGSSGRGIKSITEYYFTTQTESTPLKSSFKDTVQTPTETLPFLWNYEKIEYTDDSKPYESDVRLIGVYGSDGKSLFTWVKYADDASGTNMSDNATGKKYMGIAYNKTSATESTTASDYTWSKIQGDNGRGVSKVATEYYLSTSETTQTGGSWSENAPEWVEGRYLWTRLATTYTDGKTEYSDPVVDASWKKTSMVDEATEELNSALAGALGLHKTELDGTIYYHTNSVLQNSTSKDVIFVLNSSGFGVCESGWSNENLTFSYGVTTTGQAVWDIITAHKISADLVEAGSIRSLSSAKVQTELNLDDGTYTSTAGDTKITIYGGEFDEKSGAEIKPAGISIENISDGSVVCFSPSDIQFMSQEYLVAYSKYVIALALDSALGTNNAPALKPADPYLSGIKERDIKTTNVHCKNIYISVSDDQEASLITAFNIMREDLNRVTESLSALQQKYLELEAELNKPHVHEQGSAVTEKYVDSTCAKEGSYDEVFYCTTCGEQIDRVSHSIAKKDHSYTSVITKQPTCTATGTRKYTCSVCGNSYTETIAATEHKDTDGNGYCDVCNAEVGDFRTIRVEANPTNGGTVSGGGTYEYGTVVTLKATPNSGYYFLYWTNGTETRQTETTEVYATSNQTWTAVFEAEYLFITISPEGAGEVTITEGETYEWGTIKTLEAIPASGYKFSHWLLANTTEYTENPHQIVMREDTYYAFKAVFEVDSGGEETTYTVATRVEPSGAGTVTGGGSGFAIGDYTSLIATANPGYSFLHWRNGNGDTYTSNPLRIGVAGDHTYTAVFSEQSQGNEDGAYEMFIGVMYGRGTITSVKRNGVEVGNGAGGYRFNDGDLFTVTAAANEGYYLWKWCKNDSTAAASYDNPYTFTATSDTTHIRHYTSVSPV